MRGVNPEPPLGVAVVPHNVFVQRSSFLPPFLKVPFSLSLCLSRSFIPLAHHYVCMYITVLLSCNSYTIQFTLLKWFLVYSQNFAANTKIDFRTFSPAPKEPPYPLAISRSALSLFLVLDSRWSTFCLCRFAYSGPFTKWNHILCDPLWLTSFKHNVAKAHPHCRTCPYFIPFYCHPRWTTFGSSIQQLTGIRVVSTFWLLWICCCEHLCAYLCEDICVHFSWADTEE